MTACNNCGKMVVLVWFGDDGPRWVHVESVHPACDALASLLKPPYAEPGYCLVVNDERPGVR